MLSVDSVVNTNLRAPNFRGDYVNYRQVQNVSPTKESSSSVNPILALFAIGGAIAAGVAIFKNHAMAKNIAELKSKNAATEERLNRIIHEQEEKINNTTKNKDKCCSKIRDFCEDSYYSIKDFLADTRDFFVMLYEGKIQPLFGKISDFIKNILHI